MLKCKIIYDLISNSLQITCTYEIVSDLSHNILRCFFIVIECNIGCKKHKIKTETILLLW